MIAAPQMELFKVSPDDPEVEWMVQLLYAHDRWITAQSLVRLSAGRLDDRRLRMLAEAAAPKIISGQKGYRHTDHASVDEVRHFINQMESQAGKMSARAGSVRNYAFKRLWPQRIDE